MAPIISDSERQKIESSPTQATSAHSLHPYVSVTFQSSQPSPVASLTPPPPRHYLRNVTSNGKLQGLIQKRSDIYTRVQQAQQDDFDTWTQPLAHAEAKVCPRLLTRSSSFEFEASVDPWGTQITRSASWKRKGVAPGRPSNTNGSLTEVHVVEFESLGAQRRETMVLGLSEVDAHLRRKFDSEDATSGAIHSPVHYAPSRPNRGEVEYKGLLGFTSAAEQIPVEIEMPASDTQGSNTDFTKSCLDAVDLNGDGTAAPHHTTKSSTPHGLPLQRRRRARTLRKPKDSFPPPRGSSLGGDQPWLDPHAPSSIAACVGNPSYPHPVGFPADRDDHIRNTSHKSHSKCAGCKAVSKAVRNLGVCFRSNACTTARRPSGRVQS